MLGVGVAGCIIFIKDLGVERDSFILVRFVRRVLARSSFRVQVLNNRKCPMNSSGILKLEAGAGCCCWTDIVKLKSPSGLAPEDHLQILVLKVS